MLAHITFRWGLTSCMFSCFLYTWNILRLKNLISFHLSKEFVGRALDNLAHIYIQPVLSLWCSRDCALWWKRKETWFQPSWRLLFSRGIIYHLPSHIYDFGFLFMFFKYAHNFPSISLSQQLPLSSQMFLPGSLHVYSADTWTPPLLSIRHWASHSSPFLVCD